jgi:hypothetical protein
MMTLIKTRTIASICEDVEKWECFYFVGGKLKCTSLRCKAVTPSNLTALLLATHPRKLKTCVYPKTCTQMFTAVLFRRAPNWNQSKCPMVRSNNGMLFKPKKGKKY